MHSTRRGAEADIKDWIRAYTDAVGVRPTRVMVDANTAAALGDIEGAELLLSVEVDAILDPRKGEGRYGQAV